MKQIWVKLIGHNRATHGHGPGLSGNRRDANHIRLPAELLPQRCSAHPTAGDIQNGYTATQWHPRAMWLFILFITGSPWWSSASAQLVFFIFLRDSFIDSRGVLRSLYFVTLLHIPSYSPLLIFSLHFILWVQGAASQALEFAGHTLAHPCQAFSHREAPVAALWYGP